jgi:hypothetical protein
MTGRALRRVVVWIDCGPEVESIAPTRCVADSAAINPERDQDSVALCLMDVPETYEVRR